MLYLFLLFNKLEKNDRKFSDMPCPIQILFMSSNANTCTQMRVLRGTGF